METFSSTLLMLFVMLAFLNFSKGNLGSWLKAKFFNAASPTLTPAGKVPRSPTGSANEGDPIGWGRPVPGAVTSPFGAPRKGHTHQGVDLAASTGDPIHASKGGTIDYVGVSGDCGRGVRIAHSSGWTTRYCHLSKASVHTGQKVTKGETIGLVGATGDATGPHLHFEIRHNGTPVDPATLGIT